MRLVLTGVMLVLVGCASIEPRKGIREVTQLVAEHGGFRVHWRQGGSEDEEVDRRIALLLGQELTPSAAVEVALLNNPNLQATYEELGIAQADLVQAGLLRNPSLGAVVQFPLDPKGVIAPSFSLAGEFLELFLIPLRKKIAARQFEQAQLRVANAVLGVAGDVRMAYYDVVAAEQLLRVRKSVVEAEHLAAELSRRQHDAQNISDLDFANEVVLYEQLQQDQKKDEYALRTQRERLNRLLGVWGPQVEWKATPALPDLPAADPPINGLESRALSQRLDLAAARNEVAILEHAAGLARSNALLGVTDVGIEGGRDTEGNRWIGPSLRLQLPLFDQGQAAVGRLVAQLRQARDHRTALEVQIRSEVRDARGRLEGARRVAENTRAVILPLREQIVVLSQQRYNASLIGVYQLLQAKQAEINAHREYIDGLHEYWNARAALEEAVAGSLETPNSIPTTPNVEKKR